MKQLILTKGNYGTVIRPIIKDQDSIVVNLTGMTVGATLVKPDLTKREIVFSVADATNGVAQYQLTTEDTDTIGNYIMYLTASNGSISLTSNQTIMYIVVAEDGGVA